MPIFASVFFCYAGNERYAEHYSYRSTRNFLLWFPSPIGVFRQGKKWGLICAAPVTEHEFTAAKNETKTAELLGRLQRVRRLLGAEKLSFAGVLPTVLNRKWPGILAGELDQTPEVVRRAAHEVLRRHNLRRVVLLGGSGRIGRAVDALLRSDGVEVIVIDPAGSNSPETMGSQDTTLLVDVSRFGAISEYVERMPSGSAVLNEVFPEPSREIAEEFLRKNVPVYHIAGVAAEVFPSLPLGYKNALPCCAIHSKKVGDPILKRIV
jgi:hypothetical protein